jgi:hypothetical protein
MIKLNSILNEVKVNSPDNKSKIFDALYNASPQIFKYAVDYPTLEDFLKAFNYGDNTLEDLLINDWGYNENSKELKNTINLIEDYYNTIKPGDVKKSDGDRTNIVGYIHAEMVCVPGDDDCFIVLTKF